jgi:hypothetical protein
MSKAGYDRGAFKTPTLRDVAVRAPFMHDGSLKTLEAVVRHYARGGFPDERLDARLRRFDVTDGEVDDLVAFLEALSSDERPGLAPDFGRRAASTTLTFVDAKRRPVAGLPVTVVPAGDGLPGDVPVASRSYDLVTDAKGQVTYVPARRTHMRVRTPAGVTLFQGDWVPDTCRTATLEAAVAGRTTLLVALPDGALAVPRVPAFREARPLTDDQRAALVAYAPDTLTALRTHVASFALEGTVDVAGRRYARYVAWVPAGAPQDAVVDVPLPSRRATLRVELVPGRETRLDLAR